MTAAVAPASSDGAAAGSGKESRSWRRDGRLFILPAIVLLLVMAKFFGGRVPDLDLLGRTFSGSVVVIIVIIGLTSWMSVCRLVRLRCQFGTSKTRPW